MENEDAEGAANGKPGEWQAVRVTVQLKAVQLSL